jgi:hypothetical protein
MFRLAMHELFHRWRETSKDEALTLEAGEDPEKKMLKPTN